MPECKEKSAARLDTLRTFLTRQAGVFFSKNPSHAGFQKTPRRFLGGFGGKSADFSLLSA